VTVVRAGRRILDQVTASIPAAGITVVSGPSGAGKTTLLRLCNRLEIPDAGVVSYRGQPLDELDPLALRRRVGVLFGLHVFPLSGRTLVPLTGMMIGNSMTATVLVFLPGAMTGLILAGAAPLQAVLVQAVVMFLVLAATATTTVVIALGLIRRLFTPDHRLIHLPTPAGQ
jgi:hypothetical protein